MATRTQITDLRLLVNDPAGFVAIAEVASSANLPQSPGQQTCYYLQDVERYVATDVEESAAANDYETQRIRVSDDVIGDLIDSLGADAARCRVLRLIMTKLGADMQLASTSAGGDQATYTSLSQMYRYYQGLAKECEEDINADDANASGRAASMETPEIAGGLV